MGLGSVRDWSFSKCAGFFRRDGDGLAVAPEGQRYATPTVIFHSLGNGFPQRPERLPGH